jgi:hypothetical protein
VISPDDLRELLVAWVQLEGLSTDAERAVLPVIRKLVPKVHKLIRGEVLAAKREETS